MSALHPRIRDYEDAEPYCVGHVHAFPVPIDAKDPRWHYLVTVVHDKHCPEWCR